MDKQALLEDIYNSAFEEELEKTAFAGLAKSFLTLGKGLKAVPGMLKRIADPSKAKMWSQATVKGSMPVREGLTSGRAAGHLGKHLLGTALKSKAALATIGGTGYVGNKLLN